MSRLMKASVGALACAVVAFYLSAAVPTDGGAWAIGSGETETLDAAATVSELQNNGSLALGAGAALTANGAVVNSVGSETGNSGEMTIAAGASLISQGTLTGDNPVNTQGFSIGTFGGTGEVTVASGGSLTVTGGRLFLGRNKLTDGSEDRTKLSYGVINIFGTVTAPTVECGAWFPSGNTSVTYDVDELPVASVINLEEGGVLETGLIQNNDTCRNIVNFKGGTLRLTREANPLIYSSVSTIWNIEAGKSLVFDSQSYHANLSPALHQPDSFKIMGAGGLVKKGTGYLRMCMTQPGMNTFTGPIVVEEGYLSLGRPLADGQTVLVKSGAVFYPVAPGDLEKITYEDPLDAPLEGSVYAVHLPIYGGLDLLGMYPTYVADKIATTTWGWGGEVHGPVTHSPDISAEHPFELVGQGRQLNFYGTGLENLPLAISGTGTFWFDGVRTNETDNAIVFTGSAKYQQGSAFTVQGVDGAMPTVTVSGGGTLEVPELRVGCDARDGALVVSNGANVTVNGNIRIGSNTSTRYKLKGRMVVENATVTANEYKLGANALTDGTDYETLLNELVIGPGAVLNVNSHFSRNDDARSRIVFAGGTVAPKASRDDFFYSGQNGTLEIESSAGSDMRFDLGTQRVGMISNHTHIFGDGGLDVFGQEANPIAMFILGRAGLGDFTVDYRGATKVRDCTLRLGVPLPAGNEVQGTRATLDLAGLTITNSIAGDVTLRGYGTLVVGKDDADVTFSQSLDNVQLEKVGAGALALDRPIAGALAVREGTAVIAGAEGSVAYKSYRFKVEGARGPVGDTNFNSMQLAELVLLDGANDVTRPYANISWDETVDSHDRPFPANEAPQNLVDGNMFTKWLDYRAHPDRSATDRERVWLRIDYAAPRPITGYKWITANDAPARDPVAWRLQGSNDGGATWTDVDVVSGYEPSTTRFAQCGPFMSNGASLSGPLTVAAGATLRVNGGSASVADVSGEGTIELADGARLASAGGVVNAVVTGDGSFSANGGEVTLMGAHTYTGETRVSAGTLNVGMFAAGTYPTRAFDGKFFRLTIRRSNGGNGADATNYNMQASEFQLYDADGTMQNLNLEPVAEGMLATRLGEGQFSCELQYQPGAATGKQTEGVYKLFDNDTNTKWYCGDLINGAVANYHVITMRLKNSANPIVAYNFITANDHVRRSPTEWTLEGSRDGVEWELLDARFFAPHTAFGNRNDYNTDSVIKHKPFNNGVNYQFETAPKPTFAGKYIRFTFKKTIGNALLQLSELMLVDALGRNVAKGLSEGAVGAAAASLDPGSFSAAGNYYNGAGTEGPKYLFDDNLQTKICNGTVNGDAANYRYITIRLPGDALPVCGYVLVTANDSLDRSPCDWEVEGSVDGVNWTKLDERSGIAQPYCLFTSMNAGHPFTFDSLGGGSSLPADSVVTVDAGATLNLNAESATIKSLKVDCTLGGGTINSFRVASGGTLALVNIPPDVPNLREYEIPLTVNPAADAGSVGSWKVTVNGVERKSYKLKLLDGKLVIMGGSTVIFVR
ncbi:MAG: autotransporter-associated beta strand repeat-containing protein [Kiritimatiellae bacterium]|nr:autotransporter-associated beta strand repeat-containing protein [Kiritimatiellia bacterium]